MGWSNRLLLLTIAFLLTGCGAPMTRTEVSLSETTFPSDQKTDGAYRIFKDYFIRPGDTLDVLYHIDTGSHNKQQFRLAVDYQVAVKFPNVPSLNEVQFVRPDGTISLPYLGVVLAAGKTVQELAVELRKRYATLSKGPGPIAPGQLLTVKFVKLPNLNETQAVRPDGTISLPYLGVVQAAGKTVAKLTEELIAAYKKHLSSPELYVLLSFARKNVLSERMKKELVQELYVVVHEFRSAINEFKKDLHTAPRGLSRLVRVRPDGFVTFPLLGDIFVAGKTIPAINKVLDKRYKTKLAGLSVDLFLERHSGTVIYVTGEVNKPGAYQIATPTPVVNALALGGGALPEAALDRIVIVRRSGKRISAITVDAGKVFGMQPGAKLFYLQPDDIVYVPPRGMANAARKAREIAAVIFFRGWGFSFDPFRRR